VLGLAQLHGQPIVVLDPSARPAVSAPAMHRRPVLVLGGAPDGAAVAVDAPPVPVRAGEPRGDTPLPDCVFAAALEGAVADAGDPARTWWRFDPRRLFETLARLT